MYEGLKACPFCGCTDIRLQEYEFTDELTCQNCGATGPSNEDYNWNSRVEKNSEIVEKTEEEK